MENDQTALRFDGLTAIVTGAGRGLGAAHATLLAARGANVIVNDLRAAGQPGSAHDVVDAIRAAGGSATAVVGSVVDDADRRQMVTAAMDTYGSLDIVVNNAGVARPRSIRQLDHDDLLTELQVHVTGAMLLVSAAWPHLRASQSASVVSTASGVGLFGMVGAAGYGAAKMAVVGATATMAREGAHFGIRANVIAPIAETEMAAGVFGDLTPDLDPALVSAAVCWLVHPSCALTNTIISAGGGRVARVDITVGQGVHATTIEQVAASARAFDTDRYVHLDDAMAEAELIRAILHR